MKISAMVSLLFAIVGSSCSSGQKFTSAGNPVGAPNPSGASGESQNQTSANPGEKVTTFRYGPKTSPRDFLFVFDNSGSMKVPIDRVQAGFASLATTAWPNDARIAVMTTLPGDPSNLNRVHPDVADYNGIELEPGFLSLVSAAKLTAFQAVAPEAARTSYPQPLCTNEWFTPTEKNANGVPCLTVSVQSPFSGVHAEAGMTALGQILDKRSQLFRDGSFANIVFVSDTHDPGCGNQQITSIRPTFEQLRDKIFANSKIVGLKFHGVVPGETCDTNEGKASDGWFGMPYKRLIDSSAGIFLDFCRTDDYSSLAAQVVSAALPEPLFSTGEAISKIVAIKVNGVVLESSRYTLQADKKSIRISGLAPTSDVEVTIIWRP